MAYSLDDYNTVPERIAEAKALYPEGRFQSEVIELPAAFADKFIAVRATFYRTADDPTPAVGLAWEPVPGATNFTRQSELMNAETSAWGRALVAAFAADAKKGIASREDIESRQETPAPRPRSGMKRTPTYVGVGGYTEDQEKPSNGVQTHLTPEQAIQIAGIKKDLLARLEGDIGKATELWRGTVENFGLNPDEPLPPDMISAVEYSIKALVI